MLSCWSEDSNSSGQITIDEILPAELYLNHYSFLVDDVPTDNDDLIRRFSLSKMTI